MLTRTRPTLILLPLAVLLVCAPATAQIHGVPPSVTSFGFGGSNNPTPGVPASVTFVGPLGFNCCAGPFISPWRKRESDRGRLHDRLHLPVGVMTPAYVPYPVLVPYAVPESGYDTGEEEETDMETGPVSALGAPAMYDHTARSRNDRTGPRSAPEAPPTRQPAASSVPQNPEPVDSTAAAPAQPATVLVYKDGHRIEVQNYAIVGDTLFDFADNRSRKILLRDLDLVATRKANEDRGLEFLVPGQKAKQ